MKYMINKKIVAAVSSVVSLALPFAVMAINEPNVPSGNSNISIIGIVNAILSFIWPIFIGFAVLMFIVAAFKFFTAQGEPEAVKSAQQFVIWGIVAVAVGVLAFSLPFAVQNLLGQQGIN